MEMHSVGPRGLEFEVSDEEYERMKDVFLAEHWDSSGDFDGSFWFYEGRMEFHHWLFEQLVERESKARAA